MAPPEMLARLEQLVTEIAALHSKLILLVGPPRAGKTDLLTAFAEHTKAHILNVGSELGRRMASIPMRQRHLQADTMLRVLADQHVKGDLLLMDNIELLFDMSMQLNPLDLLKRHAHSKRVVAVWPGELVQDRLTYAGMGHPEHRDYAKEGLVVLEI